MSEEEPSSRLIATEALVYAALFLLVGALFVLVQVRRKGSWILSGDPHAASYDQR